MKFVLPAVLLLFSMAFAITWISDRGRHFLVWCSLCFLFIGSAMLAQLAHFPGEPGLNALVSTVLYVAGTLAGGRGLLLRSGLYISWQFAAISFALVVGGVVYFFYIDRDLLARVYILNFGMAVMILVFAWRLRGLARGAPIDRLLLAILVLVALQFIPRMLLTARSLSADDNAVSFAVTAFWQWTVFSTAVAAVIAGFAFFAIAGADRIGELTRERDTDPLTGLWNRRGLEAQFQKLYAGKSNVKGWIAVCDIDYFKHVNDAYGHATGDAVLREFAGILRGRIGSRLPIARIGGEEFVIYLDDMTPENVHQLLESVRRSIEGYRFFRLSKDAGVTCSIGCVRLNGESDLWYAVDRADKVLYAAKKEGRNRVYVEGVVTSFVRLKLVDRHISGL